MENIPETLLPHHVKEEKDRKVQWVNIKGGWYETKARFWFGKTRTWPGACFRLCPCRKKGQ